MSLPSELYQQQVSKNILKQDEAQASILPLLDGLAQQLNTQTSQPAKGLFLCGDVGRGKSMLMQLLFDAVDIKAKRRVHFHPFMEEMHERMHTTKVEGNEDIISSIAQDIAKDAQLLCFDEFYVTNIGDAILLGRLLEAFFKCGITLCATSNWKIEDLYQDGYNNSLFQPFIKIVQQNMQEVVLDSPTDWRRKKVKKATNSLTDWLEKQTEWQPAHITLLKNKVPLANWQKNIAICDFKNMCETHIGRSEYMALCEKAEGVIITDIPKLDIHKADSAMRFVVLVDILYENHIPLHVTSEHDLETICEEGPVAFAFQRTLSRIAELGA
jgi:cell division protein ZapE